MQESVTYVFCPEESDGGDERAWRLAARRVLTRLSPIIEPGHLTPGRTLNSPRAIVAAFKFLLSEIDRSKIDPPGDVLFVEKAVQTDAENGSERILGVDDIAVCGTTIRRVFVHLLTSAAIKENADNPFGIQYNVLRSAPKSKTPSDLELFLSPDQIRYLGEEGATCIAYLASQLPSAEFAAILNLVTNFSLNKCAFLRLAEGHFVSYKDFVILSNAPEGKVREITGNRNQAEALKFMSEGRATMEAELEGAKAQAPGGAE